MLQKGQGQPHVYPDDLGMIKVPVPPINVQTKIVKEYFDCSNNISTIESEVTNIDVQIENYVSQLYTKGYEERELSNYADFKRGPFGGSLKKEIFVSSGYKIYEQKGPIPANRFIPVGNRNSPARICPCTNQRRWNTRFLQVSKHTEKRSANRPDPHQFQRRRHENGRQMAG